MPDSLPHADPHDQATAPADYPRGPEDHLSRLSPLWVLAVSTVASVAMLSIGLSLADVASHDSPQVVAFSERR